MKKTYELIYDLVPKLVEAVEKESAETFVVTCPNPVSFRNHLREMLRKDYPEVSDYFQTTRVGSNTVIVSHKPMSRQKRLEKMLEKVLPLIDDELIYEEVMEVLYNGNGQK